LAKAMSNIILYIKSRRVLIDFRELHEFVINDGGKIIVLFYSFYVVILLSNQCKYSWNALPLKPSKIEASNVEVPVHFKFNILFIQNSGIKFITLTNED
jgi:hypothetical protein